MNYKGYFVWFNSIRGGWVIQQGFEIVGRHKYATLGAAKSAITQWGRS